MSAGPCAWGCHGCPCRDLEKFFRNNGFANLIEQFRKHKVTMEVLADLTGMVLCDLGFSLIGTRRMFARAVKSLALPPVEEGGVVEERGREEERVILGGAMEEEEWSS